MDPNLLIMLFLLAFLLIGIYAIYAIVSRLNNIEQGVEKTAILLTVLANKQGATEEDIKKALPSESGSAEAEKAKEAKDSKKDKKK